jgi:hypothetical protein
VHGPFSFFLLEEKEKMGGAKDQPSSWLNPPPPVRASTSPVPCKGTPLVIFQKILYNTFWDLSIRPNPKEIADGIGYLEVKHGTKEIISHRKIQRH